MPRSDAGSPLNAYSRSPSPDVRRRVKSPSRSPSPRHRSSRDGGYRRGSGFTGASRDNPEPSKCLGVFNLSRSTTEDILREEFERFGKVERAQLVIDRPTGESRGFGFIYFKNVDDAKEAREKMSGASLDGRELRVDFSVTKRAHSPTPGQYMGQKTAFFGRNDRGSDRGYERRDRGGHDRGSYGRDRDRGYGRDRGSYGRDRDRGYGGRPSYGGGGGGGGGYRGRDDRGARHRSESPSPPRHRHARSRSRSDSP
ncbi:unnamed protein product, partial [Mesorhabditis spiculigera]